MVDISPGRGPGVGSPTTSGLASAGTGAVGVAAVPMSGGSTPADWIGIGGCIGFASGRGVGAGMGLGSGMGISPCLAPVLFININTPPLRKRAMVSWSLV